MAASQSKSSVASIEARAKDALAFAKRFAKTAKSWTDLNNAMFGVGGKCGQLFPTTSDRVRFMKSRECGEIRDLIGSLPGPGRNKEDGEQPSGKLNVRMPRSMHAALISEAEAEGVSLNHLIMAKLAMQLRALV